MRKWSLVLAAAITLFGFGSSTRADPINDVIPGFMSAAGANGCPAANSCFVPFNATNPMPISGSFSATLSGFRPTVYGTPISATVGGATGTLPAGVQVVATNVGTTNGAYCSLGASTSTSAQYIAPNGGWFGFAISGDTQLTCQGVGGTTTINTAGGSGLPTGTGGGGGATTVTPPAAAARHFPGCTVGVASGSCLAGSTAVNFLQIQNTSTANTVACAFGATAVLNSATSVQLGVGQSAAWGLNTVGVPTGQLNCIASGASTPLYVEWN